MNEKIWTWNDLYLNEQIAIESLASGQTHISVGVWISLNYKNLVDTTWNEDNDCTEGIDCLTDAGKALWKTHTDATPTPAASEPTAEALVTTAEQELRDLMDHPLSETENEMVRLIMQLDAENARLQKRLQAAEAALEESREHETSLRNILELFKDEITEIWGGYQDSDDPCEYCHSLTDEPHNEDCVILDLHWYLGDI